MIIATMLFALQIYCDFYGYSVIALGTARCLGFDLMENFNCPYYSMSVKEFWGRWHISLSSWFKDYLYIPLGGNRNGKIRKWINLLIVFAVSGLWHGAAWTFVIWGVLNAIFQIVGEIKNGICSRICKIIIKDKDYNGGQLSIIFFRMVITFILIDFTWIFFRASKVQEAFAIVKSILHTKNWVKLIDDSIFNLGLNWKNWVLLVLAILVLVIADILKYKRVKIYPVIAKQNTLFLILFISLSICFIFVFGYWGGLYNEASFLYFQF